MTYKEISRLSDTVPDKTLHKCSLVRSKNRAVIRLYLCSKIHTFHKFWTQSKFSLNFGRVPIKSSHVPTWTRVPYIRYPWFNLCTTSCTNPYEMSTKYAQFVEFCIHYIFCIFLRTMYFAGFVSHVLIQCFSKQRCLTMQQEYKRKFLIQKKMNNLHMFVYKYTERSLATVEVYFSCILLNTLFISYAEFFYFFDSLEATVLR